MECIEEYEYQKSPIGKGSYAFVYKGKNTLSGEIVAIKKINITFVDDAILNHIKSEIKIMEKLDHQNIVKLIDHKYDNYGNIYLILEYCSQGSFSLFLNGKPLKEKYAKKFMKQIAAATKYLIQNNILHRDIKPQNILMDSKKNIKLSDFGFAKIFSSNQKGSIGDTVCGTPLYMAPEIIKYKNYGIKTDLWSLGALMYEMIIGKPLYKAKSHWELLKKIEDEPIFIPLKIIISDDCRKLIYALLQKDPNKRIDWEDFFNHPWLNDVIDTKPNLTDLIIDYDYMPNKSEPIPIKNKNEYIPMSSPIFNSPVSFTPDMENSYKIVTEYSSSESEHEVEEDEAKSERNISESLLNYMREGVNYFKSYYWG